MRPTYQQVSSHYPKSEDRADLYARLGWSDISNHAGYKDTCAIRMSYALVRAGVVLHGGGMKVKAGELAGRSIEHRQARLSQILVRLWGQPERYASEQAARAGIGRRQGGVSFFRIEGGNGGHIDVIGIGQDNLMACARSCYFSAKSIWFWPL